MTKDTYRKSLLAKGWQQQSNQPDAFTKVSAGLGGDIGFVLEADGVISQQQEIHDSDGNHIRWETIKSAHIDDFEDELSPKGLWQLKPGKNWQTTGNIIHL